MMRTILLVVSLVCLLPTWSNAEFCGGGSLECLHGSQCQEGEADFSQFPTDYDGQPFQFLKKTKEGGYFCVCPEDRTGLRCGRKVEQCGDTGHYCFHGGKCIAGLEEEVESDELFCDCSDASYNGIPYVGKFCEVGLERCAPESDKFCANRGTCKDDFENKLRPCECETGKRGPHCEFDETRVPACNLECENGGECTRGVKSYAEAMFDGFWAQHDGKFQHCECPEGYYGLSCETKAVQCGPHMCFNGGKCIQNVNANGETMYGCDCTVAAENGLSHAGQFCQSKSTDFCQDEKDANGQLFCTNNGECKDEIHEGCDCDDEYHGPMCEHDSGIDKDSVECNLQCKNDGECRLGAKDHSFFDKFAGQGLEEKTDVTHINLQHCVCPSGFFGMQCEHEIDICGKGKHVCLHGSKCKPVNETDPENMGYVCDCEASHNSLEHYAGKFCQYESTDICTVTDSGKLGLSKDGDAFCVNNGRCKKTVVSGEPAPGCNCPDGFVGEHCEYPSGTEPVHSSGTNAKFSKSGGGLKKHLLTSLAVILVLLIGIVSFRLFKLKRKSTLVMSQKRVIEDAFTDSKGEQDIRFGLSDPRILDEDGEEVLDYSNYPAQEEDEFQDAREII